MHDLFNRLLFFEQFQIHSKIEQKVQESLPPLRDQFLPLSALFPSGSVVTIDDPTLTPHYHLKSVVYIWVAFGVVHSRVWQMCLQVSTFIVSYRTVSLSQESSVLCLISPSSLSISGNHWSFLLSSQFYLFQSATQLESIKYIVPVHDFETWYWSFVKYWLARLCRSSKY